MENTLTALNRMQVKAAADHKFDRVLRLSLLELGMGQIQLSEYEEDRAMVVATYMEVF